METLNTLVKSFREGDVLTNEELNQIVSHINQVVDYINTNIKPAIENGIRGRDGRDGTNGRDGATGESGLSSLNAFVGASSDEVALRKLGDRNQTEYPPGQYSISSNVPIGSDEVLFMTTARRKGENNWLYGDDGYIWSTPIQIGSNTTSTTGTDSDKINYIYCRTTRNVEADDFLPEDPAQQRSILEFVESNPGSGIKIYQSTTSTVGNISMSSTEAVEGAWTDHPHGVTVVLPHEWMVGFKKNEYNQWEYYFGPSMVSNFGHNGLDGDGYEYIFKLTTEEVAPTLTAPYSGIVGGTGTSYLNVSVDSRAYQSDDFIPSYWSDEPLEPTSTYPYQYVSTRKRTGNQEEGSAWEAFTPPRLWSKFVPPGENGSYTQFIFKTWATQPDTPESPTNNKSQIPAGWAVSVTTQPTSTTFVWCSSRIVSYRDHNETIVFDNWCTPYKVTGDRGPKGDEIEFIYTRNNTGDTPSTPPTTQVDDWHGTLNQGTVNEITWTDNPVGVASNMMYEFVSQRTKTDGVWSVFSTPVVWSKWGEKGMDGDGYEYIFKTTATSESPGNPTPNDITTVEYQTDDYVPTGWDDDPMSATEAIPYLWSCVRKKTDGDWGRFVGPSLWSKFAEKGDHTEFRYMNYTPTEQNPIPNKPANNSNGTSGGWGYSASTPNFANGEYTWMTQCLCTNLGVYGNWTTPIRLTGDNGQPGEDGKSVEFIYTRNDTGDTINAPTASGTGNSKVFTEDDWFGVDNNGVTWTDNPQGVTNLIRYEYVSTRVKDNKTWGAYSPPVVWAKFGEKGQDGDGYEYIYTFGNGSTPSAPPVGYGPGTNGTYPEDWPNVNGSTPSGVDHNNVTWYDDPQGVSSSHMNEWVSVRKKTNGTWGNYSTPSLWSTYAESGGRYEFRYKNYTPTTQNPTPAAPTGSGSTNNWTTAPTSPNISNGEFTWMSHCYVTPGVNGANDSYGTWTTPIRISGENGEHGADGKDIEFIYTRVTKAAHDTQGFSLSAPTASGSGNSKTFTSDDWFGIDSNGVTWTDNPVGVNDEYQYEYISTRIKPAGINQSWGAFSPPSIWSKWGEKGMDGDGYEYIYKVTTSDSYGTHPKDIITKASGSTGNTKADDDFVPDGWTDDPSTIDAQHMYQWCSVRKKHNNTWGDFGNPTLWARYAEKGSNGGHYEFRYKNYTPTQQNPTPSAPTGTGNTDSWATTPTTPSSGSYTWMSQCFVTPGSNGASDTYGTWTTPIRITGDKGEDGNDGADIEFIYTRNNTGVAPSAPPVNGTYPDDWPRHESGGQSLDHDTDSNSVTWYDNPQGVVSNMMYEYVSMRTKSGTTWGPYSTPVIWAKWGEKGMDGDGYEYIYTLTSTATAPTLTPPYWGYVGEDETLYSNVAVNSEIYQRNEFVPEDWYDDPDTVDSNFPYQWVSKRKKHNNVWEDFSAPSLWTNWAPPGTNGSHYEFRYKNSTSPLSDNDKPDAGTDGTTNNWSTSPSTTTSSALYVWMTQCQVSGSGTYGTWTTPIRLTGEQGQQGADGQGANSLRYIITTNVNEIKYSLNHAGEYSTDPTNLEVRIYKFNGTGMDEISPLETNHFLYIRKQKNDLSFTSEIAISLGNNNPISGDTSVSPNKPNLFQYQNVNSGNLINAKSIQVIYAEYDSNNNSIEYKAIKDIAIKREYQRMLIPCGAYENKIYSKTDTTVPLVVGSDNKYYYLDSYSNAGPFEYNYAAPVSPTDTTITSRGYTNPWTEATEYKVMLVEALFANFAKLGSFVIYDKYFFSQFGYKIDSQGNEELIDSTSNAQSSWQYFDPSDPMASSLPSSGNYKFKPMKVIDAESGEEWGAGGNIHMGADGSVSVKGNIQANTLIAGKTDELNITTTGDRICFNQGNDTRAYFISEGSGLQLYIRSDATVWKKIDFSKWSDIDGSVTFIPRKVYTVDESSYSIDVSTIIHETTLYQTNNQWYVASSTEASQPASSTKYYRKIMIDSLEDRDVSGYNYGAKDLSLFSPGSYTESNNSVHSCYIAQPYVFMYIEMVYESTGTNTGKMVDTGFVFYVVSGNSTETKGPIYAYRDGDTSVQNYGTPKFAKLLATTTPKVSTTYVMIQPKLNNVSNIIKTNANKWEIETPLTLVTNYSNDIVSGATINAIKTLNSPTFQEGYYDLGSSDYRFMATIYDTYSTTVGQDPVTNFG